ncbi:hypothetical protein AB1Y20_023604 [Prymnesium parvum]|uniref:Transmembrane protein n=1 Tax=Prymnesium parvum TaxID=97485 RepID=A0AB34JH66_PRYPA
MLVAEKQLLDANLRNDLQSLRRLEIKMLVSRYQTAIPAATLIVGFTFTSIVELDYVEYHHPTAAQELCERLFYVFTSVALAGSLYAMAVSSIAIMLGQRLAVQATASLSSKHGQNVEELAHKFVCVLVSLLVSLIGVVAASICAIWVKAEGSISVLASALTFTIFPLMVWSVVTMNLRLNDGEDEPGSLSLYANGKKAAFGEFRIGDSASIPVDIEGGLMKYKDEMNAESQSKANERSALLKCVPPPPSKPR